MSNTDENQIEQTAQETQSSGTETIPHKSSMAARSKELLRKVHDSLSFGKKASSGTLEATGQEEMTSKEEQDTGTETVLAEAMAHAQPPALTDDEDEDPNAKTPQQPEVSHPETTKMGTIQKTKMLGKKIYRDMKKGLGGKGKSKAEHEALPDTPEASKTLPPEAGDVGKKDNSDEQSAETPVAVQEGEPPVEAGTTTELPVKAAEENETEDSRSHESLGENDEKLMIKSEQGANSRGEFLATQEKATENFENLVTSGMEVAENEEIKPEIQALPTRATKSAKRFIRGIVESIGERSMDEAEEAERKASESAEDVESLEDSTAIVKDILRNMF